jgi:hypothetical protein
MACHRCGCRMITKVGRSAPMLICTDCGLPVDPQESAESRRKHVWGYITLVGLASIGGAMFLLASMNEMRTTGRLEIPSEGEKEKESRSSEGGGYFHPGGIVQYR